MVVKKVQIAVSSIHIYTHSLSMHTHTEEGRSHTVRRQPPIGQNERPHQRQNLPTS